MRFQKHINEAKVPSLQFVLESIYKHSRDFLRESKIPKYPKKMMLSGRRSHQEDFFIGRVRKNRRPMDTPEGMHELYDELFIEKFGWPARSQSIFCTSTMSTASRYGTLYIIFPIKRYMYVWSPEIQDMFRWTDSSTYWRELGGGKYAEEVTMEKYTNKNLHGAIQSGNEIMVGGNQYLAFKYDTYYSILYAYWAHIGDKEPTTERLKSIEDWLKSEMYREVPILEPEK